MSPELRVLWMLFAIPVALVVTLSLASEECGKPTVASLRLEPGQAAELTAFRPFEAPVELVLSFSGASGSARPELGNFWCKTGHVCLDFPSPGSPVVVRVQVGDQAVDFEALPAQETIDGSRTRTLIPRAVRGDLNEIRWPPSLSSWSARVPHLRLTHPTVRVSVLEVGRQLTGEQVRVILEPPLRLKNYAAGYGILWLFIFWPLYAAALGAIGVALAWFSLRQPAGIFAPE